MTDLTSTFDADSTKSVSRFSSLQWFLLFEYLYNGEGSLQASKEFTFLSTKKKRKAAINQ